MTHSGPGGRSRGTAAASLIILASLLLSACGPDYAAQVNGEDISLKKYRQAREARLNAHRAAGSTAFNANAVGRAVLEELIAERLMLQAVKKRGLEVTDEEVRLKAEYVRKKMPKEEFANKLKERGIKQEDFLGEIRAELLIKEFRKSLLSIEDVPYEEIKRQYEAGPRPLKSPETVTIRLIETRSAEKARGIHDELAAATFDEVAEKLGKSARAAVSRKLIVPMQVLHGDVRDALGKTNVGGYTGPVHISGAWQIYKLYERKEAVEATFDEAKETILLSILKRKRARALNEWLRAERRRADIKINEKKL